jgi:predicted enzyme related to lactoylglutathione lyase
MMPLPTGGTASFWQPYFAVDSLDAAQASVRELGGRVLMEPMPVPCGAFVAALDPQGAVFLLLAGELDLTCAPRPVDVLADSLDV